MSNVDGMTGGDAEAGYRQLSKMAVIALAFAVLGLLGLLVPVLSVIAVLAAVLAAVALNNISKADGLAAGGRLASIALLMSLAVIGNAVGYQFTKASRMVTLAQEKAEHWFAKVAEGDRYVAHQLMKQMSDRVAQGVDLNAYYAIDAGKDPSAPATKAAAELEAAFADPDIERLADQLEAGATPQFKQPLASKASGYTYDVDLEYEIPGEGPFLVTMRREFKPETRRTYWQFIQVQWKSNE